MKFTILTLFPGMFDSYLHESILRRAQDRKLITVHPVDIRAYTDDKHHTADSKPYGGGPGMVMKAEPILKAFSKIKKNKGSQKIIILSPGGKSFTNVLAKQYAQKYKHLVLISGRYEGIDGRVKKVLKADEVSIGDYVLTGGELPAMVIIDAVSRHIPGVLGRGESLEEGRFGIGVPTYTRPEVLKYNGKKYSVPKELLGGDHAVIEEWRTKHKKPSNS